MHITLLVDDRKALGGLAKKCAEAMNTTVEEVYTEDFEVSDAGFSLENGYHVQIATYMKAPFLLKHFDGSVSKDISEHEDEGALVEAFVALGKQAAGTAGTK
ncbi:hypothetical protein ACXWTF_12730 [Thiomicrolovo sp. ZZH C-3]